MSNETRQKIKGWLGGSFVTAVVAITIFLVGKVEMAGQYKNQIEVNSQRIKVLEDEVRSLVPSVARIEATQNEMRERQKEIVDLLKKK